MNKCAHGFFLTRQDGGVWFLFILFLKYTSSTPTPWRENQETRLFPNACSYRVFLIFKLQTEDLDSALGLVEHKKQVQGIRNRGRPIDFWQPSGINASRKSVGWRTNLSWWRPCRIASLAIALLATRLLYASPSLSCSPLNTAGDDDTHLASAAPCPLLSSPSKSQSLSHSHTRNPHAVWADWFVYIELREI
jgi:hypothetical protein